MTLTIQDLGALGEFLGSIAVLVTLIYLALQMRQNTMAIAAQLDATRIATSQNLYLAASTSKELQEALAEDRFGDLSIPEARRQQYRFAQFLNFQWQLVHVQRGLLPSVNEAVLQRAVVGVLGSARGVVGWWENTTQFFLPEFVEWVEEQRAKAA